MTNVAAIVQARMGSSRLPNKMMLHLHGAPIIEWVFQRVGRSKKIDNLAFAVPDTEKNVVLVQFLEQIGAKVFTGDENDVLARFYEAARSLNATHVVRVCADNPVVCPVEIDSLVDYYFNHSCDYVYNHIPINNSYPDGLGAEIVSIELLEEIQRKAHKSSQREHLFNYIWEHQEDYSICTFDPKDSSLRDPSLKLDIDTFNDYEKFLNVPIQMDMATRDIVAQFREFYEDT